MKELGSRQESLATNMSEKGLFLETDEKFEVGDFVFVELILPIKFQNTTFLGVVRWFRNDPPGVGIEVKSDEITEEEIVELFGEELVEEGR